MHKKKILVLILIFTVILTAGCDTLKKLNTEQYSLVTEVVVDESIENPAENPGLIIIADTENISPQEKYFQDETVSLEAKSNYPNYSFEKWEVNGAIRRNNPTRIYMDQAKIVKAYFTIGDGPFKVITDVEGQGEVIIDPKKEFYEGEITLTAEPDEGYKFSHWDGDIQSDKNPETLIVNNRKIVTAVFVSDTKTPVSFEEEKVEKVVRGILDRPYGYIFKEDLQDINELDLAGYKLDNFSDLKKFTNLEILNLNMTGINDLTILSEINNDNLKELYLADNGLRNIDVISELKTLEILDLSRNKITDISALEFLKHVDNLKELYIVDLEEEGQNEDVEISDISPLSGIKSLEVLNLNGQNITDLSSLTNLTNLITLKLSNNSIDSINVGDSFMYFTDLKTLHLDGNQLEDVDLEDIKSFKYNNLEEINLNNNKNITDFSDLKVITSLKRIYLKNNNIEKIPDLSQIDILDKLYLTNNNIYDISGLNNMSKINRLYLNNNNLNDDPDITVNNRAGDPKVLSPIDPDKTDLNIDLIDLRGNDSLDGETSKEIINRLKENGTKFY